MTETIIPEQHGAPAGEEGLRHGEEGEADEEVGGGDPQVDALEVPSVGGGGVLVGEEDGGGGVEGCPDYTGQAAEYSEEGVCCFVVVVCQLHCAGPGVAITVLSGCSYFVLIML